MRTVLIPLFGLLLAGLAAGCAEVQNADAAPGESRAPAAAAGRPAASDPAGASVLNADGYRVTGPYGDGRLAVYLLHTEKQDPRRFLTLAEGLRTKQVKVQEKSSAEVSELVLTNASNLPLFLQEGDTLDGGQQDRIVQSSLVIPPNSKRVSIPAFCVEQDRWHADAAEAPFAGNASQTPAPRSVRAAAKVRQDQSAVWKEVAETKADAARAAGAPARTSSLNEALDSRQVRTAAQPLEARLKDLLGAHPDAVGVAFAVGGKIEEVDIYPNHDLLGRLYPGLLRSFAVQAATGGGKAATAPPPAELAAFMKEGRAKAGETRRLDRENSVHVADYDEKAAFRTEYAGSAVHKQMMRKDD